MNAICAISLLVLIVSHGSLASAHGVVGDYVFLEPLITQDPTPANELDILQPSWVRSSDANTYSIGFSTEKVLYLDDEYVPRFSIGGGSNWSHVSPFADRGKQGFDDLTLFGKYAFYYSLEHEFMLTIAAQLELPTGNTDIEAQSHTSLGPVFLWEKGMGDLPNLAVLKYLRPFGVQSDFGYVRSQRRWNSLRESVLAVIAPLPSGSALVALSPAFVAHVKLIDVSGFKLRRGGGQPGAGPGFAAVMALCHAEG